MSAPLQDLSRAWLPYVSDDGNTYNVGSTGQNASAQTVVPVAPLANPAYPRGWRPRYILGVATGGFRTKVPICAISNALWTSTNTFTKNSTTYAVEGRIGERRTNKGG